MVLLRYIGRWLRRSLAVLLYTAIRGRRTTLAILAVVVVGWLAVANISRLPIFLPGVTTGPGGAATKDLRVARPAALNAEAVPAVDNYIKGLTQFDARLMWGSLSEEMVSSLQARGGSVEAMQAGLDDAKRRGGRYEDITMIGHYPLEDGRKYLFYVLSRRGFAGPDQLEQIYFVFTVSREGKITRIE